MQVWINSVDINIVEVEPIEDQTKTWNSFGEYRFWKLHLMYLSNTYATLLYHRMFTNESRKSNIAISWKYS